MRPRTRTAYYFTEKGNQLREMPTNKADIEKNKQKKKDADTSDEEECRKKVPFSFFWRVLLHFVVVLSTPWP